MPTTTDLYNQDFFAWTQATAAMLRQGQWDALDTEALAEEIESLGKSEKRELESRLEVLVMHLLKWQYQPERREYGHSWSDTIREQRNQIVRLLRDNPSLRPKMPDFLSEVYPDARERAVGEMGQGRGQEGHIATYEGWPLLLPHSCPWTAAQALDKAFWPLAFPPANA